MRTPLADFFGLTVRRPIAVTRRAFERLGETGGWDAGRRRRGAGPYEVDVGLGWADLELTVWRSELPGDVESRAAWIGAGARWQVDDDARGRTAYSQQIRRTEPAVLRDDDAGRPSRAADRQGADRVQGHRRGWWRGRRQKASVWRSGSGSP